MGLFSYYRKFIKDFATIAAPLYALTKQARSNQSQRALKKEAKAEWKEGTWGEDQQRAWETLKGALLCRPVLSLPRKDLHWRLATDASNVAMGAVLSQYDNDNVEHPIGFYSRKLNDSETRWVIWELELGAVVWASTLCRPYLRAVHFELVTDSKVVAALLVKEVPPRRENFIIRMSEFNFTVVHRKGELNRNADFFSRWAKYKEYEEQTKLKIQCLNCVVLQGMQEWLEQHKRVRPDRRLRTRSIRRYGKDLEELTPQQLDELTIKPCAQQTQMKSTKSYNVFL